MALAPVWELGGTIFDSKDALSQLIAAASQDDVQPQAVRAAEALGSFMLVSDKRIAEGVDALGGNDSVRLQHIKSFVGLSSGGVRRVMRESSGLVKFFLFCTACRLCYIGDEIGDMAFEMMSQIGLIDKTAVSSSQLARLASQIAGHGDKIVPIELFHSLAVAIDHIDSQVMNFTRLGYRELAQLIIRMFEGLRDATTTRIHIYASKQCVWLSTILCWLLGEDVSLTVHDHLIMGSGQSKIVISLGRDRAHDPWTIKVFQGHEDVTTHVYPYAQLRYNELVKLPRRATLYFISNQRKWGSVLPSDQLVHWRWMCGAVIRILVDFLLATGRLKSMGNADNTRLTQILPAQSATFLEQYGWPSQSELESEIIGKFGALPYLQEVYAEPVLLTEEFHTLLCPVFELYAASLREQGIEPPPVPDSRLTVVALTLALDAVFTSLGNNSHEAGQDFISLEFFNDEEEVIDLWDTITNTSRQNMGPEGFLTHAVRRLLPGVPDFDENDLLVRWDGMVAGLAAVWHLDTSPHALLRIQLVSGDIRREGRSYDRITEFVVMNYDKVPVYKIESLTGAKVQEIKRARPLESYQLNSSLAVSGSRLEVSYSILNGTAEKQISMRFKATLMMLALADRQSTHSMVPKLGLVVNAWQQRLYWLYPQHAAEYSDVTWSDYSDAILLIPTWSDPTLMLLAAAASTGRNGAIAGIVVHEAGPLQPTIDYAASLGHSVVIVVLSIR